MLRLKQSFYDQGEKPGKLLAWRIKQLQSERAINAIENVKGEVTADPIEINNTFREFYESLYSSEYPPNSDAQTSFLDNLKFPNISKEVKTNLDSNLTMDEILDAIDAMNAGKRAGPDGLPIDIYKKLKSELLTPIMKMFQKSYKNVSLPPSLRGAMITLLLKPNKPAHKCQSYRPISLLNSDIKIFARH